MNKFKVVENGDFLADCPTNIFYLSDLCGLQWKKFACPCSNGIKVCDDPALTTYSKALKANILCVWQRSPKSSVFTESLGTQLLGCPKELFIFWFGETPVLFNILDPSITEVESGSYEDAISAEYLELFFKSIHNIIERSLLNKNFIRLGDWFTTPQHSENSFGPLSFRFKLSMFGGRSVVASIDIQEKSPVQRLPIEDIHSHHFLMKDKQVLLAPYGLNAHLTGQCLTETNPNVLKILEDWQNYFPCTIIPNGNQALVEVSFADSKMWYPAHMVMTECAPKQESTPVGRDLLHSAILKDIWNSTSQKHGNSPKQMWNYKENRIHHNCSCTSSSNSTRVKQTGNRNVFSTITKPPPPIIKPSFPLQKTNSNFHKRKLKEPPKKPYNIPKQYTTGGSVQQESFTNNTPYNNEWMLSTNTVPSLCSSDSIVPYVLKSESKAVGPVLKSIHVSVTSPDFVRPQLPVDPLEPRQFEVSVSENVVVVVDDDGSNSLVTEDSEVMDTSSKHGSKRANPSTSDALMSVKNSVENFDPPLKKSRLKSQLGHLQTPSPDNLSFDEDVFSPTRRQSSTRNVKTNTISPSNISQCKNPNPLNHGSLKTPNTPKDQDIFRFGSSTKVTPLTSPSTPHFSPSIKTKNLMSTKDLMPVSDDLDHLFDDEDDDDKKHNVLTPISESPADTADSSHLSSSRGAATTIGGLTQHDLAQMFPTPPSQEPPNNSISPTMPASVETSVKCPPVLSHDVLQTKLDGLEVPLEAENSQSDDFPTFSIPLKHILPSSRFYTPISLPSDSLKTLKYVSYTPSWDVSQNPPVLLRHQSVSVEGKLENKYSELSPCVKPLSTNTDHSLLINLALSDSVVNWMSIGLFTNISPIHQKTYKLFLVHQNKCWSTPPINKGDFFPGDSALQYNRKIFDDYKGEDSVFFDFNADLVTLLLRNLSSTWSIRHLITMLSKYYAQSPTMNESNKHNTLKTKLLKQLIKLFECTFQCPARRSVYDSANLLSFKKLMKLVAGNPTQSVVSINPLLFRYDGDNIAVSPETTRHWQAMVLEPFAGPRNAAYIVAIPENDFIVNSTKKFFKELSAVYESLNLGTHCPIVKDLRDGILRIHQKQQAKVSAIPLSNWFDLPAGGQKNLARMKYIAQFCKHQLAPYLASISLDSSLSKTSDSGKYSSSSTSNSSTATVYDEAPIDESRLPTPTLVIYLVDPFHGDDEQNMWSYIAFMHTFTEMSAQFNNNLKENICLQIIPLEQLLQVNLLSRNRQTNGCHNEELKSLSLSVYSQCRSNPISESQRSEKCMTDFGILNNRESLIRRRQVENNLPSQVFRSPYILHEPTNFLKKGSMHHLQSHQQFAVNEKVLYCSYCLTFDNNWMCVACTDNQGELFENTIIKITYPTRKTNSLAWRVALRKLWEYIMSVISFTPCVWRIVLTKPGEVGQMELKEMNVLIHKQLNNIVVPIQGLRPMSPLSEICLKCSTDAQKSGKCVLRSVSFCVLKKEQNFKILPWKVRRNINMTKTHIFVTSSPKEFSAKPKTNRWVPPHEESVLTPFNDFEEMEKDNLPNFMLSSPTETSLLYTSPHSEFSRILSASPNVLSPQSSNLMPTLSPFQPIQAKQNSPMKQNNPALLGSSNARLASGYLLSGSPMEAGGLGPSVIQYELCTHDVTTQAGTHPLDSRNYIQVLKHILERFNTLSWLTVNPCSGKRESSLPVHITTTLNSRHVLAMLTST